MDVFAQLIEAILPGVIVGIVMSFWNGRQKKVEQKNAEEEKQRLEYDSMRLDLLVATAQLSYAVAMAIKRGTPNGEMETAIERYETAMNRFREYERVVIVREYLK